MKNYTFALPEPEAKIMDANIALLQYAFPNLDDHDALLAILRMGSEEILRRLQRLERQANPVMSTQPELRSRS